MYMKKNNILKYGIIILIFSIICIFLYTITSNATTIINPDDYKPSSNPGGSELTTKANLILGVIQVVGSIVSVIVLVVIGIKYVIGSAQEKAEYKKTMIPYLIGAVLLFAASNIVQVIYEFGLKINQ